MPCVNFVLAKSWVMPSGAPIAIKHWSPWMRSLPLYVSMHRESVTIAQGDKQEMMHNRRKSLMAQAFYRTSARKPLGFNQGMNGPWHTLNRCAILSSDGSLILVASRLDRIRTILLPPFNGFGRGTPVAS